MHSKKLFMRVHCSVSFEEKDLFKKVILTCAIFPLNCGTNKWKSLESCCDEVP